MQLHQELALQWLAKYRNTEKLSIAVPKWAEPLRQSVRFKAAWGGRAGGKSHYFAEAMVERMVENPNLRCVCIREIQRSLKFSAKFLIESKIRKLGVAHLFDILTTEIRRKNGSGILIFEGMQDHTADSIKSLEGFGIAWVEEAQSISARSLSLLIPTIRSEGSEVWFSWNPDQPEDAVDKMFRSEAGPPPNSSVVSVSYLDNPHCTQVSLEEAERARDLSTDLYNHVWLGDYNTKSKAQIFSGKWRIDEFEADESKWDGPYYGADWGFGPHPTAAVRCWIYDRRLWIDFESHEYHLELDDIAARWECDIPFITRCTVRADSAEPSIISHVRSKGCRGIVGVDKWPGSVAAGIKYMQNFQQIVIHSRCKHTQDEFRLYSHKVNKAGDVLPDIVDAHNHLIDSIRYAIAPLIKKGESHDLMAGL
jgi:phage terminase large subunit